MTTPIPINLYEKFEQIFALIVFTALVNSKIVNKSLTASDYSSQLYMKMVLVALATTKDKRKSKYSYSLHSWLHTNYIVMSCLHEYAHV